MFSVNKFKFLGVLIISIILGACQTTSPKYESNVNNTSGRPTVQVAPESPGPVQGIGIESQDIISMTDKMMREMLSNRTLAGRSIPPRIIIDSEYFSNESSSRINKNLISDRLRLELNKHAQGRMIFVGRHFSDMVAKERELKRSGNVDSGTVRQTAAQAGGDFRLGGRITSHDAIDKYSGNKSRYTQISFEMIDLEYGTIVWGGLYEFKKSAQDDIIYR